MDLSINKTFILFFTVAAIASSTAQQYPAKYENYNLDTGISQSLINCITQDQTGFLWIGTQEGLNCFDGYEFKIFKNDQVDTGSISNNNIRDIYVDSENNLWIGTHGGGLNKFDKRTQTFSQYTYSDSTGSADIHNIITKIIPSGKDVFYLGTENDGLIKFEINKKKMQLLSIFKRSSPENNITSALPVSEDRLLLGTDNGLFIFDKKKNLRRKIHLQNKAIKRITCLYQGTDGKIIAGTFSGLVFKLSLSKLNAARVNTINPVLDFGVPITVILSDNHGGILIGTDSSISVFDESNLKPRKDSYYFQNLSGSLKLRTNVIFIDKFNVLWAGTFNKGVFKFAPKYKKFKLLKLSNNPDELNKSVWSILKEQNGIIWVGTDGNGLIKLNTRTGEIKNWRKNNFSDGLNSNSISSILKDRNNNYWFTTFGGGINFMSREGKFQHYINVPGNDQSISSNHVWKALEDKVGNIWIGSKGGLDCITFPGRKFIHYRHDEKNPASLSNNNVLTIYEDKEGTLWIGTYGGGLNKFERNTGRFVHYIHNNNDPASISDNSVMSICEDKDKNLWLGCDIGMNKFDRRAGKFTRYYEKDGLPNNVVYAVIPDLAGNIWASTNKGISCFNPAKNIFRNYDFRDGLQSNEFNEGAYFQSSEGEIFFGGIDGVSYFKPREISINKNLPTLFIKSIKILNSEFPTNQFIKETHPVNLSYFENYIQIEFAGLEFTEPVKNMYSYKLDGFDNNWITSGARRVAIYTNLSPGKYAFRVRASNNDGKWSNNDASLMIFVSPPFWKTWWFRITAALFILSVLYALHILKVKRMLAFERLRLQIASDLHDEVGATLTSLSIQTQLLNLEKDTNKLSSRINLIEELSIRAISTMSDVVWSIDSRNDTLEDLINRMKDFSSQLLNDMQIQTCYSIKILNPEKKISIDVRHNTYLIFKEAVNNIAKHSNAGNAEVKILSESDMFEMYIHDDGIGTNLNENKNGNGLRNMAMRAKRIGGRLEMTSKNGLTLKLNIDKI